MFLRTLSAASVAAALFAAAPAQAVPIGPLHIDIVRQSDSVAVLTATGSVDATRQYLILLNVASTGGSGLDAISGNFKIGGISVADAYVRNGENNFMINFNFPFFNSGDTPSGSLTVTLDTESWFAIGSTGLLADEMGDWAIVGADVPLPAAGFLLLGGLGALAAMRRKPA